MARGGALAVAAARAQGSAERQSAVAPVVLGEVSLSFYAAVGGIVQEVLERLGHPVDVLQGPHEEMFPLLAGDRIDLLAAAWLPGGHDAYWARYGGKAQEVAKLYEDARFFWAVTSYVPLDDVASIEDLVKPSVAKRMTRLIQGIGPGATITTVSGRAIEEYGLARLGYALRPGTPAEWTRNFDAAVAERRWIVFPTWAPQYLNRDGQLRPLADPRGVLGGPNRASLVAPRERFHALAETTRAALARIELGLDGVTEMDWLVNVERQTPRDATRMWMRANDAKVSDWLKA